MLKSFIEEMEVTARCIRYVKKRLEIGKTYLEKNRHWLSDRAIRTHQYNIDCMEYALGITNEYPSDCNSN